MAGAAAVPAEHTGEASAGAGWGSWSACSCLVLVPLSQVCEGCLCESLAGRWERASAGLYCQELSFDLKCRGRPASLAGILTTQRRQLPVSPWYCP